MPLIFSLILTVASRLLHPYSTDDKTSRLMVKRFSTVGDTQRDSWSCMEKRDEGDRSDQEEKKKRSDQEENGGSQKMREQSSQ